MIHSAHLAVRSRNLAPMLGNLPRLAFPRIIMNDDVGRRASSQALTRRSLRGMTPRPARFRTFQASLSVSRKESGNARIVLAPARCPLRAVVRGVALRVH